jgi:hypothetical protein
VAGIHVIGAFRLCLTSPMSRGIDGSQGAMSPLALWFCIFVGRISRRRIRRGVAPATRRWPPTPGALALTRPTWWCLPGLRGGVFAVLRRCRPDKPKAHPAGKALSCPGHQGELP